MANRYWLTTITPSTFHHFVSYVVQISAKKQVVRVYANRIITFMQNVHTGWDSSVMQLITKTVYSHVSVINAYLPIAIRFATSSLAKPVPAVVSFSNLPPKSILRFIIKRVAVSSKSGVVGSTITKTTRLAIAIIYLTNSVRSIRHSSFSWLSSFVTSQHSSIMHLAHIFRVNLPIAVDYDASHVVKYKGVN